MDNEKRRVTDLTPIRKLLMTAHMCKGTFDVPGKKEPEFTLMYFTLEDGLIYAMTYAHNEEFKHNLENTDQINFIIYSSVKIQDFTNKQGYTTGTRAITFRGKPSKTDPEKKDELIAFIVNRNTKPGWSLDQETRDGMFVITVDIDQSSFKIKMEDISLANLFDQFGK